MIDLKKIKKAYFIGLGGIGMSAIARYLNRNGVEIHGYDLTSTPLTTQLSKEGMQIHFEENVKLIPEDLDLIVYTPAVPKSNKEMEFLMKSDQQLYKRSEILGMISRSRPTIAIAGTHGKTTTSTMLCQLLEGSQADATAFLGGISLNLESNYKAGKSDWVIAEADEYDRSFLRLFPKLAVVLAADPDHLDIYGDEATMLEAYRLFLDQVEEDGIILLEEKVAAKAQFKGLVASGKLRTFGFGDTDYQILNLRAEDGKYHFDLKTPGAKIEGFELAMAGRHNVKNASAAIAAALEIGVSATHLKTQLAEFKGIRRRFEIKWKQGNKVLIDDYAHHPEELEAAIQAAREFWPHRHLTGIFQPHLFSRTRDFADGFARALDKLDTCVLIDIYPAREEPIAGVNSGTILDQMKLKNKSWIKKKELPEYLGKRKTEVLMTLGAGDLDQMIPELISKIQ